MPLSETWGLERSGFLEKIITAAQSSYNVVENVPSGTCEEIGFERKPAARNGTDAQSSAILSSAFISRSNHCGTSACLASGRGLRLHAAQAEPAH